MFENGYSDGEKEENPESWYKHITGLSQHLLGIFNLHFRNCKESRQYKGHLSIMTNTCEYFLNTFVKF